MAKMDQQELPKGSILPNWPLLLGGVVSFVGVLAIFLTSEPEIEVADALDQRPVAPEVESTPDPEDVSRLTGTIRQDALRRQAEVAQQRRRGEQEAQRRARQAQIDAQRAADALRRARVQAERLRNRPSQPSIEEVPTDALAVSSDETELINALRLEERQREAQALRAPAVVSSARGIGERTHQIREAPVRRRDTPAPGRQAAPVPSPLRRQPGSGPDARFSGPVPVPPPRQSTAAEPAFPPVFSPPPVEDAIRVPGTREAELAAGAGAGFPEFPGVEGVGARASPYAVAGPGAPRPVVQNVAAASPASGTFSLGPRADGNASGSTAGVVVTPHDEPHQRLYEGTLLPAALQTQLNGQYSGPLSAQITRSVWSRDRRHVLIPRGTIALGTAGSVEGAFQDRLAITFHRLIFPDGRWLELGFVGLNGLGETSLKDLVDRHYLELFGTAGAVGLLAGFTQAGTQGTPGYRSSVSEQMANTSLQIVARFLNRRPDITIRAGHRVNVRLTSDVVIPADML